MVAQSTLFRARVPAQRLKRVGKILERAGLSTGEAVNVFLAQVEINNGLPFQVRAVPAQAGTGAEGGLLRSTEQTMQFWDDLFDDEFSR